jgi:hypothetical protein
MEVKGMPSSKTPVSFAIRADILAELMLDKVYSQKLHECKYFYEVIEVVREFAEKKGYKSFDIPVYEST